MAKGDLAWYNMTSVEIKTFTYSAEQKSLSIDNVVLGQLQKRLLFTMIKKKDLLGSLDTNTYHFHQFDLSHFTLFYKGESIPSEGLIMNMGQEKTTVLAFITQYDGSGMSFERWAAINTR